ncbi:hypothetical protein [Desulfosporosinus sp. BICA1-9]|uniref:hypothetical protein n=1 Tax=Desulfosporosinus sp. BICA1-9 TaxID=1531958 RepID=UPI00054BE056|nr:hypothetical protein [Desulfosporosinus sp. BICA1-9]KJS49140.1 MAG: hypothetical protein VR66_10125 [Peptococcaceae bacterium BRH_c23]KJS88679.1 MAG: hypothetical protein JL57_10980 [Desulfosporosinus sp. BICA1-9]
MRQFKAKKWFFTFMILLGLVIGTKTAYAETAKLEIINMDINVMPEYDTPDILVIYSVDFKNTSDQPYSGEFVWNLPKDSKKYTVADKSKGDNHVEPTVKHSEKNDQIVWKFPTPLQPGETKAVQIEYYYNNLQGNPDKTFVYEYIPEYPVVQAEVTVFQPKKASNMVVTPDFGQAQPGYDGFSIYKKEFKTLKPGDNVQIKASYTKSDPNPSVAPLSEQQGQSGQPTQSTQSKRTSAAIVLFFIAAFVGVLGLIIYKAMNSKHIPINRNSEEDYEDEEFIIDKEIRKMQNSNKKQPSHSKLKAEKKKLRDALLSGRISEGTYHQLLAELKGEEDS